MVGWGRETLLGSQRACLGLVVPPAVPCPFLLRPPALPSVLPLWLLGPAAFCSLDLQCPFPQPLGGPCHSTLSIPCLPPQSPHPLCLHSSCYHGHKRSWGLEQSKGGYCLVAGRRAEDTTWVSGRLCVGRGEGVDAGAIL